MSDDNVHARLEQLEARLDEIERSTLESRLEQFRGRIDDLKVQSSLARMDTRDDVRSSFAALEDAWNDVRGILENLAADTKSARSSVAEKARNALGDLRSAIDRSADALRRNDS